MTLKSLIGTGVESLPQIITQVCKEIPDSAECHKGVRSMHNLSVLLLNISSNSGNLSKSDFQILQSVICNLSQCLMKSTVASKSIDLSAFMPDKELVAAKMEETKKGCCAAEENEDLVEQRIFQKPAEVCHLQMANIEAELNIIKSEIRCLRTKLEMKGLKTLYSRESNRLPDLNLDPIMDDGSLIGECCMKNCEDGAICQSNISEETMTPIEDEAEHYKNQHLNPAPKIPNGTT